MTDSFVKLSSPILLQKLENTSIWVSKYKQNQIESIINRKIIRIKAQEEKKTNNWFNKLIGYKAIIPTRQEILENPDAFGLHYDLYFLDLRCSKYISIIDRLKHAAKQADEVYVSTQDLEYLI